MNKEQTTGVLDETKGKVKEGWGKLTNDPGTQVEGLADQVKGKVEKAHGNLKEAVKDDVDNPPPTV